MITPTCTSTCPEKELNITKFWPVFISLFRNTFFFKKKYKQRKNKKTEIGQSFFYSCPWPTLQLLVCIQVNPIVNIILCYVHPTSVRKFHLWNPILLGRKKSLPLHLGLHEIYIQFPGKNSGPKITQCMRSIVLISSITEPRSYHLNFTVYTMIHNYFLLTVTEHTRYIIAIFIQPQSINYFFLCILPDLLEQILTNLSPLIFYNYYC